MTSHKEASRAEQRRIHLPLSAVAVAISVAACGGGGGGGGGYLPAYPPAPAPAPAPAPNVASGVAATGSPFAGASVVVTDKLGVNVCDTVTDARGAYNCELPTTTVPPLVVTASRDTDTLYSVSVANGGRINVTPLTTVVASRLSVNGDPARLAADIQAGSVVLDEAGLRARVAEIVTALQPLLQALGDSVDPITGVFDADGSGHDRVLDSISVSVRPDGTAASIEVTLQAIPASADAQPVAINFRSNDASIPPLPPVSMAQLAPAGIGDAIHRLLAEMTACYALPMAQRVRTASSDTGTAVGNGADVVGPACRAMFFGSDPLNYLHSGSRVGRDANNSGAFSGLFRGTSTGQAFDQGALGHYRAGGDVVVRYRSRSAVGAESFDSFVARYEGEALKIVGNQYAYSASVTPSVSRRDYLNAPGNEWIGAGYNIFVANRIANGQPVFSRVDVTAPTGRLYRLLPDAGSSFLAIANEAGSTSTLTSTLLLNGKYIDGRPADPRLLEPALFVDSTVWSDAQIQKLNDTRVWKMEFFHADPAVANVIQYYATVKRPLVAAEALQKPPHVTLTAGMRARLIERTAANANGLYVFGAPNAAIPNVFDLSVGGQPAWEVPSTANAPTLLSVFGRGPLVNAVRPSFNDDVSVTPAQRSATVLCSTQSASDNHCDASTGTLQYALNSYISTLQLYGRSSQQTDIFSQFVLFKPAP